MFGTLNEKLEKIVNSIKGKAIISEEDLDITLREIRNALLEADVALSVVKKFIENILRSSKISFMFVSRSSLVVILFLKHSSILKF